MLRSWFVVLLGCLSSIHEIHSYFVHKDSTWTYSGRESLQNQIIGTVQGYAYPEPLRSPPE